MAAGIAIPVDVDSFVRAETDTYLASLAAPAGLAAWTRAREPVGVDGQTVVRMKDAERSQRYRRGDGLY